MPDLIACPECGARVPDVDVPGHAYVAAAPGCWQAFGEVQAEELNRFGYPSSHGIVVDAYCAQHVGDGSDRRARQSVVVHLMGLCSTLERGADPGAALAARRRATRGRPDWPALARAGGPGELTVLSLRGATDLEDYDRRARRYAAAVWAAWADAHAYVRGLLDA